MLLEKQNKNILLILWGIFSSLIGYFKFVHHELWKDEWQAWFVAKDKTVTEILSFLYYEGHPALWYLYLKLFTIFSDFIDAVMLISVAHMLTVVAGLYFLFVRFRIPVLLKVLFALSYCVFFEYGIVNRGYFLVLLFVFWAAWLLSQKHYSKTQLGVILFLLCQTEVYGTIMSIALGVYIFANERISYATLKSKSMLGLAMGILIFMVSVFPRSIGHVAKTNGKELALTDKILTAFQGNLSNTYLVGSTEDTFSYGWTGIGIFLSTLCLVGLWHLFNKYRPLAVTLGFFVLTMISFSTFLFLGGIRQWGMGFVFLIALTQIRGFDLKKEKISTAILIIFCFFNLFHGLKAIKEEINIPFTNAKQAGNFIKEKVPKKVPIVAINKFESTPVIGYAGRKFFELPDGMEFSYFKWVDKIYYPTESELRLFGKFKGVGGLIILSPKPLDPERFPAVQLWQKFDAPNYKRENYFIYTLSVK